MSYPILKLNAMCFCFFRFSDLKLGLAHLKRKATQRQEGPIAFVRSNLSSTLDCLDSLSGNRMTCQDFNSNNMDFILDPLIEKWLMSSLSLKTCLLFLPLKFHNFVPQSQRKFYPDLIMLIPVCPGFSHEGKI